MKGSGGGSGLLRSVSPWRVHSRLLQLAKRYLDSGHLLSAAVSIDSSSAMDRLVSARQDCEVTEIGDR